MATAPSPDDLEAQASAQLLGGALGDLEPATAVANLDPHSALMGSADHPHGPGPVLRRVRQHVAERLGEAAAVEPGRDRTPLPLDRGVAPGTCCRTRERRQLNLLALDVGRSPAARRSEIGETGTQAVELGVDHSRVVAGGGVAAKRLAHQRERRGRSPKLVLGARDLLRVAHSASVSL